MFPSRVAVVSPFGIEAAVLLDHVARVDPNTRVIFLDAGIHSPEIRVCRTEVIRKLYLVDVPIVTLDRLPIDAVDLESRVRWTDCNRSSSSYPVSTSGFPTVGEGAVTLAVRRPCLRMMVDGLRSVL